MLAIIAKKIGGLSIKNKKINTSIFILGATFLVASMLIIRFQFSASEKTSIDVSGFKTYRGTLKNIKKNKVLRVLTTESSFNYFIYKGRQAGYEYDLAKAFVKHLNTSLNIKNEAKKIKLKMIPIKHDMLFSFLDEGVGDVVAAGLSITEDRKKRADFSTPYNSVNEVLVSQEKTKLNSLRELSGKSIHIRKSSSYYKSLIQLNRKLAKLGLPPAQIQFVDEQLDTASILEMVSMGTYEFTVADSHIAYVGQKVFGGLTLYYDTPLSAKKSIAWALPKNANLLKDEVNEFLPNYVKGTLYGNINIDKYYKNIPKIKGRFFSQEKGKISPYDELFKKYGKQYGWDWKLLAALAYQESRFRQNIKNRWGAIGVMQIKRKVASEPYVGIPSVEGAKNYENNIHAGVKYLTWIKDTYFDRADITKERQIHLSLAAYNAGPGRLKQARKKAEELGYDPDVWFGEVEYVMIKMNKIEPVKYVKDISLRAKAYSIVGPEKN